MLRFISCILRGSLTVWIGRTPFDVMASPLLPQHEIPCVGSRHHTRENEISYGQCHEADHKSGHRTPPQLVVVLVDQDQCPNPWSEREHEAAAHYIVPVGTIAGIVA